MNTFGYRFKLTTFGESHGHAVGGVIDGCPPKVLVDFDFIRQELKRRRPGQSELTTPRFETDEVTFLSGIYDGMTTGAPIGFIIKNENQQSDDYDDMKDIYRPSHADYTYDVKYGHRDPRGGGRSSARETVSRCVAGAIAKLCLKNKGINIQAYTSQIGKIRLEGSYKAYNLSITETNAVRCPDDEKAAAMESLIKDVKAAGDSVGGVITCVISGLAAGYGDPVFMKLHAMLGAAMLSIPAAKGFDYGDGFDAPLYKGSEHNDLFYNDNGTINTRSNYSGGIQGGISNGQDVYFRVAFKAPATLIREQQTVNKKGQNISINPKGRHDPCVIPRAIPVVEAMTAISLLDTILYRLY